MWHELVQWLEAHLLQCSYKEMLGTHCPGCGMQRALIALLKGDLLECLWLYPPLLPTGALFVVLGIHLKWPFRQGPLFLKSLFGLIAALMLFNYCQKFL